MKYPILTYKQKNEWEVVEDFHKGSFRVKKGGMIDITQDISSKENKEEKKRFFKFKKRRNKND
jgi:hypothetical protein